ncbi:hypothetical protein GGF46_003009 [Coemansia sp. RSA 552]|nr:hypothetical protein GGF46_003009 [Coemansia sp. RSA 552]
MAPHFSPPMWEQRRICIVQTLQQYRAQCVLEVGCGEGNVLAPLTFADDSDFPVTQLYGIDCDAGVLEVARERLRPMDTDRRDLRVDPLTVDLYCGDGCVPVAGITPDAVVCSEVLEHVPEARVGDLTRAVLAGYGPRVAVFTTPNAEFNVNFPDLQYGTQHARFRDADHKFEWTRAEFRSWAEQAACTYGYRLAEVRGIGMAMRDVPAGGFAPSGGCTQMAVFERSSGPAATGSGAVVGAGPRLFASLEFPVYDCPRLTPAALRALVLGFARAVADGDGAFEPQQLWAVLEVRQQFKRRRALDSWLAQQLAAAVVGTRGPGTFTLGQSGEQSGRRRGKP